MEVGNGMMFPGNVVDGLVHQLGGRALARECQHVPARRNDTRGGVVVRCPEGTSVHTGPGVGTELEAEFDSIIHTVPPFFDHPPPSPPTDDTEEHGPEVLLQRCYQHSLTLAEAVTNTTNHGRTRTATTIRIACPLLGAGCRGFPLDVAIEVAAMQARQWQTTNDDDQDHHQVLENSSGSRKPNDTSDNDDDQVNLILAFGIPDPTIASQLTDALDQCNSTT